MIPRKSRQWTRLDNAAKIFPPTSTKRSTNVFRFACELFEPVEELILQKALDQTMEFFPGFRCILQKGLFWYYLEQSELRPLVELESHPPCSPLYHRDEKSLLFEVTHFRNRINVEIYHALADGTGALQFLRVLTYHYLIIKHRDELTGKMTGIDYDASDTQRMDDSFSRYYDHHKKQQKKKSHWAYKVKSSRLAENRLQVIEGVIPVDSLLSVAREQGTTVTVLLTAIFLRSIYGEMAVRDKSKPVVVSIPVNLRKFFDSESARNFFALITVEYDFSKNPEDLNALIHHVDATFKRELTQDRLEKRMNSLTSIEHNVFARIMPLVIKDFFMKMAYDLSAMQETTTLSNIGKITMPEEVEKYIRLFDVFVSANKVQICMCSFKNNMTVSFSSPFISTDIQRRFFRALTKMGVSVQISANQVDRE